MTSCKGICQPYVLWKLILIAMFVNNVFFFEKHFVFSIIFRTFAFRYTNVNRKSN